MIGGFFARRRRWAAEEAVEKANNEKLFFFAYLGYLQAKESFPELNHSHHEPDPELFDLTPEEAVKVRLTVCREFDRRAS